MYRRQVGLRPLKENHKGFSRMWGTIVFNEIKRPKNMTKVTLTTRHPYQVAYAYPF